MRQSRLIGAVLTFLIGLTFFGQGIGLIPGSRMTGSSFWAVVGAIAMVAAVAWFFVERRRTAKA
ncbi:MAG TPA: hypothetical protein VK656_02835 [Candidatus Acidoferrum sp.]|nr:hypothetical protein [Candidatus Acidoferrum sp.]